MLNRIFYRAVLGVVAAVVGLMIILPTPAGDVQANDGTSTATAFVEIDLFDGTAMQRGQTVVIEGATIVALGADINVPDGAKIIDGAGRTLLPGLIDAHVHTYGQALLEAPRFGVTTVLDMFTDPATLSAMGKDRESDAPTQQAALFSAGMLATAKGGHGTQYGIDVDTLAGPDEADAWVAARQAEGSDYIKLVYDPYAGRSKSIDLPTATAVINAAHERNMMAVAHVTDYQAADDLIEAGINGFVHVFIDKPADPAIVQKALDAGIFIVPTLTVMAVLNGDAPGEHWLEDARFGPLLSGAQRALLTQNFGQFPGIKARQNALASVGAFHAAGVPILSGTDAPNPGTAHGVSQHDELELLVAAGLTPLQALRSATSLPAERFELTGRGIIAAGARADLVLVEGDPSDNILATRNIIDVYRNGVALERSAQPAASSSSTLLPAQLGDFEDGSLSSSSLQWTTTTDEMMGGGSAATLSLIQPGAGGSASAAQTVAEVSDQFPYPWAGFFLDASPMAPADISPYETIRFDIRGTAARYRLMLFTTDSYGAPPTIEFDVGQDWQTVSLRLAEAGTFDPARMVGMAIVTPLDPGQYTFAIDNVQLMP